MNTSLVKSPLVLSACLACGCTSSPPAAAPAPAIALPAIRTLAAVPQSGSWIVDFAADRSDVDAPPAAPFALLAGGVYLVNADSGECARWEIAAPHGSAAREPARWAGGAGRLFYRNPLGAEGELESINLDGDLRKYQVAHNARRFEISADGRFAAELVVMMGLGTGARAATFRVTPLSPGDRGPSSQSGFRATSFALSPTGDRIAYVEESSPSLSSLSLVARGGGKPRLVSAGLAAVRSLKWSPDGKLIALQARAAEGRELDGLIVVSIEDGKPRPIPLPAPAPQEAFSSNAFGGVKDFAWSPDSARLALLFDGAGPCWTGGRDLGPSGCYAALYTVRADGSSLARISQRYQSAGTIAWLR